MFDYRQHFDAYCRETGLALRLSFDMPPGYETANGTFDVESKTVYINSEELAEAPDWEKAFYLFHELRHAAQNLLPERFSGAIRRSLPYVIQYDGTCYKLVDGEYFACRLEGGEEYFADLYAGQPYEADANEFAYERAREIFGDSAELRALYAFWRPRRPVSEEEYEAVFEKINEKIGLTR